MASTVNTLKFLRQSHLYIGLVIAPSLLFFALTGAMQTFSLHEGSAGSSYKPPAWIATLAQIHKDQTDVIRKKPTGPKPTGPAPDGAAKQHKPTADSPVAAAPVLPAQPLPSLPTDKWKMHLPLKIFFLLVALGLFTSTLTGIYMAYKYNRNKVVVTCLLATGIVLPLILLKF
jgi:hypothetical protein